MDLIAVKGRSGRWKSRCKVGPARRRGGVGPLLLWRVAQASRSGHSRHRGLQRLGRPLTRNAARSGHALACVPQRWPERPRSTCDTLAVVPSLSTWDRIVSNACPAFLPTTEESGTPGQRARKRTTPFHASLIVQLVQEHPG